MSLGHPFSNVVPKLRIGVKAPCDFFVDPQVQAPNSARLNSYVVELCPTTNSPSSRSTETMMGHGKSACSTLDEIFGMPLHLRLGFLSVWYSLGNTGEGRMLNETYDIRSVLAHSDCSKLNPSSQ